MREIFIFYFNSKENHRSTNGRDEKNQLFRTRNLELKSWKSSLIY